MRHPLFPGILMAPALAMAAHYTEVKIALKLVDPDSIQMEVDADHDDLLNTVAMFPDNQDTALMRVYQKRIEAYLVSRLPVKVDGKPLSFRAIQWKPDGKGPQDGFDSISIYSPRHVITFGAALPKTRKALTLRMDLWVEYPRGTLGEVAWYWNGALLDRRWSLMEKTLTYPLDRETLLAAKNKAQKTPPPPRTDPAAIKDEED